MINRFVNDICEILDIIPPEVSFDVSHFQSKTMMAQCISTGETIFIRPLEAPTLDYYLAIAHELRHVWQIRSHQTQYFENYKTRDMCSSLEEYNLQPAEIDANAFGQIMMIKLFRRQPMWQGFSAEVILAINKRAKEISAEL